MPSVWTPSLVLARVHREKTMRGDVYAVWRVGELPFVGQSIAGISRAVAQSGDRVHVSTIYRTLLTGTRSAGFRARKFSREDLGELNRFLGQFQRICFVAHEPDCWELAGGVEGEEGGGSVEVGVTRT